MESNFDPDLASIRRKELLVTFSRMVDYAQDNGVRVFLIAGDLFDTSHPSHDTEKYVMDCMADHPNIDFLCLAGNHTGGFQPQNPPANYKTFPKQEFGAYRYGNVVIWGSENNAAYHGLSPEESDVNIVTLHGQVGDAITDLAIINPKFYQKKNIDYLALGHYHRMRMEPLDTRGKWAYCGTPEGRGFDESGEKGFILIETEGKKVSTAFIPFAKRTIHLISIDISRLFSHREIEKKVQEQLVGISKDDIIRVTLRGICEPELNKDVRQLHALLEDQFFFVSVVDESSMILRPESYENDVSLRGEFVRTVIRSGLSKQDQDRIIRCGIQALNGEEIDE
jgi:DNA repair exonuclease SbcCD nuclease subunit